MAGYCAMKEVIMLVKLKNADDPKIVRDMPWL